MPVGVWLERRPYSEQRRSMPATTSVPTALLTLTLSPHCYWQSAPLARFLTGPHMRFFHAL
jgi:hypothetical protein